MTSCNTTAFILGGLDRPDQLDTCPVKSILNGQAQGAGVSL